MIQEILGRLGTRVVPIKTTSSLLGADLSREKEAKKQALIRHLPNLHFTQKLTGALHHLSHPGRGLTLLLAQLRPPRVGLELWIDLFHIGAGHVLR